MIEDTTADYDDLEVHFAKDVADVVAALPKDMRMPEAAREIAYDEQLKAAPWQVRLVKLADVYDNLVDCLDEKMTLKAIAKARRALACAGNEPELGVAKKQLESLVGAAV